MKNNEKENLIKLGYDIPKDDFSRAGEASSSIKKILGQLGIDAKIIRRVAIVAYEAEMNIVIHSDGGRLTIFVRPDYIQVIAKDDGPGIENIDFAMQEGYSTASNEVRELGFGAGMGLPNMKRYSDEFSLMSEKGKSTVVDMIIYIK